MVDSNKRLSGILQKHDAILLKDWVQEQSSALGDRSDLIKAAELKVQSKEFLGLLQNAVQTGNLTDIYAAEWEPARDLLSDVSRTRSLQGFTPSETANFVFSLKKPLFARLQEELKADPAALALELWTFTTLLDKLVSNQSYCAQSAHDLSMLATRLPKDGMTTCSRSFSADAQTCLPRAVRWILVGATDRYYDQAVQMETRLSITRYLGSSKSLLSSFRRGDFRKPLIAFSPRAIAPKQIPDRRRRRD